MQSCRQKNIVGSVSHLSRLTTVTAHFTQKCRCRSRRSAPSAGYSEGLRGGLNGISTCVNVISQEKIFFPSFRQIIRIRFTTMRNGTRIRTTLSITEGILILHVHFSINSRSSCARSRLCRSTWQDYRTANM